MQLFFCPFQVNGKEMIPVQLELVSTPHEISVQYLSLPDDEPLYWRIPSSCARFQWDPTEPKNTATFLKTFETRIEVSELRYEMDHPLKMHKLHVMYNSADRIVSIQSNRTNGIMVLHLDYAYQYTRYTLLNGNEMCDVRYGNFELIELIKSDLDIFGFISNLKLFRYHGREMIRDRVCDVFVHRDQNEMGTFVQTELYLAPNGRALTDSPYDPVVIRRLHESNYYVS